MKHLIGVARKDCPKCGLVLEIVMREDAFAPFQVACDGCHATVFVSPFWDCRIDLKKSRTQLLLEIEELKAERNDKDELIRDLRQKLGEVTR